MGIETCWIFNETQITTNYPCYKKSRGKTLQTNSRDKLKAALTKHEHASQWSTFVCVVIACHQLSNIVESFQSGTISGPFNKSCQLLKSAQLFSQHEHYDGRGVTTRPVLSSCPLIAEKKEEKAGETSFSVLCPYNPNKHTILYWLSFQTTSLPV